MAIEKVDAIIVGAGASGSVLAKELALAGIRVIVLERGPQVNPDNFGLHDEMKSHTWRTARTESGTMCYQTQVRAGTVHEAELVLGSHWVPFWEIKMQIIRSIGILIVFCLLGPKVAISISA